MEDNTLKTRKLNKKLELNKKTISTLTNVELALAKGGIIYTGNCTYTCPPTTNEVGCTFGCWTLAYACTTGCVTALVC